MKYLPAHKYSHAHAVASPGLGGATRLRPLVEPPPLKLPSSDGLRPLLPRQLQPRAGAKAPTQLPLYIPEREGNGSWIENCVRLTWEQNWNCGIGKTSASREETCQVHSAETAQDTKTAQMRISMLNEITSVLGGIWDKVASSIPKTEYWKAKLLKRVR